MPRASQLARPTKSSPAVAVLTLARDSLKTATFTAVRPVKSQCGKFANGCSAPTQLSARAGSRWSRRPSSLRPHLRDVLFASHSDRASPSFSSSTSFSSSRCSSSVSSFSVFPSYSPFSTSSSASSFVSFRSVAVSAALPCPCWHHRAFASSASRRLVKKSSQSKAEWRYKAFKQTLRDPEDIFLGCHEAQKMFDLSKKDLDELGEVYIMKESPEAHETQVKQYPLKDVVDLAKRKHSEDHLLKYYQKQFSATRFREGTDSHKIFGHPDGPVDIDSEHPSQSWISSMKAPSKMYWYTAPSTTTTEGRQSILQGLRTNVGIFSAKGLVWLWTGSHVIFADMMHSFADVLNYAYRLMELNRSSRQRDFSHPYGYAPLRYITADRSFVFLGFVGGVCPVIFGCLELVQARGALIPMGDALVAPALVFLTSICLEGIAVKTAYHEILTLHAKELGNRDVGAEGERNAPVPTSDLRKLREYLREGRDVMSTATFTEASSGVLASMMGLVGLYASWYMQSGTPDVAASVVMGATVCWVSAFLLRKSGIALLGQTLPKWRVQELIWHIEEHAAVVNVYDVKTEMIGTDTVRFKAEVQFNPQTITTRMLELEQSTRGVDGAFVSPRSKAITKAMQKALPRLHRGFPLEGDAIAWLYKNNALFYEALSWELKDVEKVVRGELRDFRHVHIDLEPW
eukprot:TRINITY_DN26992_c0_g1_i1.p1 TRINITY_DN26992_c0_g1~~TRINITY_DN26992_c0_g1_i1.p1  ORF type:complete len:686 (+),score=86.12 TRINITY_DN26992_c0_g1_i1:57-2114(+)